MRGQFRSMCNRMRDIYLSRLTEERAVLLDNLDVKVSTRQSETDAKARYESLLGAATAPFLSITRAGWGDDVVINGSGRWVRLGGQTINVNSDPAYQALISNAPYLADGADIIPKLTSNTSAAGYEVSAGNNSGSAWVLFDKAYGSGYMWNGNTNYVNGVGLTTVDVRMPSPLPVSSYALAIAALTGGAPVDFTLRGSNDGIAWTDVDVRTGVEWPTAYGIQKFTLKKLSATYRYYRLQVTRVTLTAVNSCTLMEFYLNGGTSFTLGNTYDAASRTYAYMQTREAV